MNCEKIRKYLPQFEEHLKACRECREEKGLLDKTWDILGEWESIEPPADFKARVLAKIEAREQKREILFRLSRRMAPVMASILVLLLSSSIFIKARRERLNLAKDIELYQNLDIIQDMDLLSGLEFLLEKEEDSG